MSSTTRLSPREWTDAALGAMGRSGTAGVNIEQLARELGTTKGSFYHHFDSRQALLEAALLRWEQIVADDIESTSHIDDPRDRLIAMSVVGIGTALDGSVDLALAASVNDHKVAATIDSINQHRLESITGILERTGMKRQVARDRAVLGLAAYLGVFLLQQTEGTRMPADHVRSLIDQAIDSMLD